MEHPLGIPVGGYYQKQVRILFRPLLENELPDMPVEQFMASLRFEQRGKLDQLGIKIDSIDTQIS